VGVGVLEVKGWRCSLWLCIWSLYVLCSILVSLLFILFFYLWGDSWW